MRANKILQFTILFFLLFFLVSSLYNYTINNFILKTDIVQQEQLLIGYDTKGFLFKEEEYVKASEQGEFQVLVSSNQRVARKEPVAQRRNQILHTPISGMVSFLIDGHEKTGNPLDNAHFNFAEIKENYEVTDKKDQQIFEKDEVILKVINNLRRPSIYMETPLELMGEPLTIGMVLRVTFAGNEEAYRLRITNLKGIGQEAMITADFLQMPEDYERIQPLTIITEEKMVSKIPRKSLVRSEDGHGVYKVEKGFIRFHPIEIENEEGNYVLTESLDGIIEIIINPRFAKEGKFIR